jgi:AAA15 family ATPase/GTPase
LDIEGLKRVNLIVGKNNTGKTTLLEALRILASGGDSTVVNNILKYRGQFTPSWDKSYEALFFKLSKGENPFESKNELTINDLMIESEFRTRANGEFSFVVTEAFHVLDRAKDQKNSTKKTLSANDTPDFPNEKLIYVPFQSDITVLQHFWDNVSLTSLEDDVVKIIKETIEPRLVRIDVSSGLAKVRLEGIDKPIPIQVLGDGVQRILMVALALVNSKGKILLIDELESGLHHSVQETLWEMIFEYAQKFDIQVFVTTHSKDTLRTFKYVSSEAANKNVGFLFRLQHNRKGKLEAIAYNQDRLEDALEMNLEIR